MRSTVIVVMIAMLVAAPAGVSAQSVAEGSRVRARTADSTSVGTLTERTQTRLTLQLGIGSEIQVPWANVERLDMSLGKKRNIGKGALLGLGAGFLAGLVVSVTACEDRPNSSRDCEVNAHFYGPFVGAIVGALVGAFIKTERWEKVAGGPQIPLTRPKRDIGAQGKQITLTLPSRGIGAQVRVGW